MQRTPTLESMEDAKPEPEGKMQRTPTLEIMEDAKPEPEGKMQRTPTLESMEDAKPEPEGKMQRTPTLESMEDAKPEPEGKMQRTPTLESMEDAKPEPEGKMQRTPTLESMEDAKPEPEGKGLPKFLLLLTLVTYLGTFQCGFNMWLVSDPTTSKQNFYNFTEVVEKKSQDNEMHFALLVFTIAAFPVGSVLGSLLFAPLADKCGRKGALLVDDLVSVASSVILAVSKYYHFHGVYALALFLTGVCSGVFFCAIPIYVGEICPSNLRGSLTSGAFMFVGIGMLFCQVIGGRETLGNNKGLPFLLSIPGILALFQLVLLLPFPESPRYLLIQKGDEEGARQALQKLRNQEDVEDEMEELRQEDLYEKNEKEMTILKLLRCTQLRWQLICVFTLFSVQQFSGINAAYYYSDQIFQSMGVSEENGRYVSALLTFLALFINGLSVYYIDSWGRRPLLLIGVGICIISCVLITMSLELQVIIWWMAYVSCFLQFIFICGIAFGPNSIPYLMLTELFLQSSRASAYAIGGFCQWFLILFVGFAFALIQKHIRSYSFFIFLPFSISGFYFILKVVPETKNKTFLEIRKLLEIYLATKQQPAAKKKPQRHSSRMKSITGRTPYGSLPSVWYPRRSVM